MKNLSNNTLIFIPARKGLKIKERANLQKINGKTLLQLAINFAKDLNFLGDIFVSSNDIYVVKKYKKYSYNYVRPKKFTRSNSNIVDSILHGLGYLRSMGKNYKNVILLPPTSPLRKKSDLKRAFKIFKKKRADALVSTISMRENPYYCIKKKKDKWSFLEKKKIKVNFNKDNYLFIDSNFLIAKVKFLQKNKTFLVKNKTKFFIQKRYIPIDLNEFRLEDLKIAVTQLKRLNT